MSGLKWIRMILADKYNQLPTIIEVLLLPICMFTINTTYYSITDGTEKINQIKYVVDIDTKEWTIS